MECLQDHWVWAATALGARRELQECQKGNILVLEGLLLAD